MKKAGHFFFTFVPLLLALAIQYLAVFFCMGISSICETVYSLFTPSMTSDGLQLNLNNLFLSDSFNTGIFIVFAVFCIAAFGIWYYAKYEGNYLPNPRKTFHPLCLVGLLLIAPGLQYLTSYLMTLVGSLFPDWMNAYIELLESAGMDSEMTAGMFLYSVILAPISEELIFRGVTLHQAKKFLPFWAANTMQAVLFGIFHQNMIQGIYAFFIGLFLGLVCEKGFSIYHSILLHMFFNGCPDILMEPLYQADTVFSILFWFIISLVVTAGGVAVFYAGASKLRANPASAESC